MRELKKCPFCGRKVDMDRDEIFCACGVKIVIYDFVSMREAENYTEARARAVEAWNNRVNDIDEIKARIKEVSEILKNAGNPEMAGALMYATAIIDEQAEGEFCNDGFLGKQFNFKNSKVVASSCK